MHDISLVEHVNFFSIGFKESNDSIFQGFRDISPNIHIKCWMDTKFLYVISFCTFILASTRRGLYR